MKRFQIAICLTLVSCLVGPALAGGYIPVGKISGRQFVYRATTPTKIASPTARIKATTRGVSLIGDDQGEKIHDQLQQVIGTQGQDQNVQGKTTVDISLDHADGIYYDGQSLTATITPRQSGYLYVFNVDSEGNQVQLFPNRYQSNNQVQAGQTVTIPEFGARFRININAPFGEDMLVAILTSYQVDKGSLAANSPITAVIQKEETLKKGRKGTSIEEVVPFSSASVVYTTKPGGKIDPVNTQSYPNGVIIPKAKRRIGLFIGINTYADDRIQDLKACTRDASRMSQTMVDQCGLDYSQLLIDREATLAAIKGAFRDLATQSQPGDEVFVFWSGHGGTCADVNGDEKDGLDEYLVPCDGRFGSNNTMLLDDDFDQLVAGLQGRKLTLILDTCHSGGISGAQKGMRSGTMPRAPQTIPTFDFVGGKRPGIKDVTAAQAAMLCSSQAEEFSLEREAGDLSVMTYCLIEILTNSPTPLTFTQAAEYVAKQVPIEVKKDYPGFDQKPHWVNQLGTIYIKQ